MPKREHCKRTQGSAHNLDALCFVESFICDCCFPSFSCKYTVGCHHELVMEYLCLISSTLILSCFVTIAKTDTLSFFPESSASSNSTSSKIKRRCPIAERDGHQLHPSLSTTCLGSIGNSYITIEAVNYRSPISVAITGPGSLSLATWNDTLFTNLISTLISTLRQCKVGARQDLHVDLRRSRFDD